MAKYNISYSYYKLDEKGRPKNKTSTMSTVEATSDFMASQIIRGKHPGYEIEFRKIVEIVKK